MVFRRFACLKTGVFVGDAAVAGLVFFMFHVLFAGIRLRMWCLRWAMRRLRGVKCRNGCELLGLRGGLRRLPVAVSDLSVVVLGFVVMFGLFPVGNGGLRVGNRGCLRWVCFVFGLKKGGTSHDVPMLKKILVDFRLDLPFCILSFDVFAMQR